MAFSGGAGSCNTGVAVGAGHLVNPTTGSLKDGNFQVATNGNVVLSPNLNITAITPRSGYQLNVLPILNSGAVFRGVLIRVEGPGNFTLNPRTNAQVATLCSGDGVLGVTHIDSSNKTEFGAAFKTDSEGTYLIEITVVVANSVTSGSIYYYDSFEFTSFEDIPEFPTVTPRLSNVTVSPVAASVPSATVPVAVPVPAPVGGVVNTTNAPVVIGGATTIPPTMAPSITMSPSMTRTPSGEETIQPSTMKSDVPSDITTLKPTMGNGDTGAPMIESVPTPMAAPVIRTTEPAPTTSSGRCNVGFSMQALFTIISAMLIVSLPII